MFLHTKKEDTSYTCRINATNEKAAKSCSQRSEEHTSELQSR